MMSFLLKLLRFWKGNVEDRAANPRKSDNSVYPRLYESRLESRRVLNAAPLPFPTDVSELLIDAGEGRNDGGADTFEIRQASSGSTGQLQVLVNAQKVWEGAYNQLDKIRIEGSSDSDVVKIDAELNWQGTIQFSGGPNDEGGEDSLQVLSSPNRLWEQIQTRLESNTWSRTYYAASDSQGLLIEASGVESMQDRSQSTSQTYDILQAAGGWGLESLARDTSEGWVGQELQVLSNGTRRWAFADSSAMQIRFFEPASTATLEMSDLRTNAKSIDIQGSTILVHGQITASSGARVTLDAGGEHSIFVSGTIDVSGRGFDGGGQIVLLGDRVELNDGARLNASSDLDGGQIWIGGGRQGALLGNGNAQSVRVSASALVEADSIQHGDGGSIVIWSEASTVVEGTGNLRARGGLTGGNGGFIETSSRGSLQVDNPAVLTANAGRGGLWLVDPSSIVIVSTPTANTATVTYVLASTIESQLNNGVSVSYITSTGTGDGDILIQAAINVTGTNNATLSLNATRDIQFNASGNIAGNQKLSLQLTAGRNLRTDSANLSALRELNLSATSGDITLGAVSIGDGVGLPGFAMTSVSRSLATTGPLTSLGGDIQLKTTDTTGTSISLDDVSTASGDLEIQAASIVAFVGGAGSIQSTSGQLRIQGLQTTTALGFGTGASGDLRMSDASLLAIASGFTGGIQYGQSLQTGKITLAGTSHTYTDALTIVASGGADVIINSSLTVQGSGNSLLIQGSNASEVELAGNLQTRGGSISIVADRLLVDSSATRTIESSGGGSATGGVIQLGNINRIDGKGSAANLQVWSQATNVGGNITIGNVVKDVDGSGVNRLSIQSSGSVSDGTVTIGSVRLIGKSGTPALFQINQSDATATDIIASGVIDLRDGTLGQQAGSIDFGSSRLTPLNSTSVLELRTQHTGLGVVDNGNDGGDIRIGGVANQGSAYFDTLLIDMRGAGTPNESGTLSVTGTGARVLSVDGFNGGSASAVGIEILGTVELAAANPLSLQTNPGGVAGLSSRAIDLRNTSFTGSGSLSLVTGSTVVGNSSNVAGNVFLADVDLSTAGSSLSIDTRGTTIGRTRLEHPTGSAVTVTVHGDLDFRNTLTELVDSATLRVLGDTNELKLGDAVASGSQNLNLLSEGSISVGSIDLNTGSLSIQLDTDNDSISALTATGALDAGSITFTGSALGNDTVWLGGDVTTGSGAIQFVDLSSVQLASNTDLRSATNISMAGEVGVLELVGASGTNILEVRGSNTTLETPSITGTGNVTLELLSDHSILLGNVLLTNGLVEASIGRSTARTDTMFRAGSVQARGLRVTGGDPANDEALFTDQLDLGVDGLLVEDVQSVDLSGDIFSDGDMSLEVGTGGTILLNSDITTNGSDILFLSGRVDVDGTAVRTLTTGGTGVTANTAGQVQWGAGTSIAGVDGAAALEIDTRGVLQGGAVTLGTVVGTGSGVNRLSIQSSGSVSDGTVTIGSVRLIGKSGTPALFQINQSDATATDIIASGVIDLRDGTLGQQAGSIDFGSSRLTPLNSTSVLELRTQHTGLGVVDNGNDGGDIRIGGVANQGSAYFDTLLIDMRGAGTPNESGTLSVTGTGARVLSVDGFNGGSASAVGIEILGTVELAAANPLSLQTNPGGVAGLSSRAIDLRNTSFTGSGSLSLVTGSTVVGNSSNVAGNVFLADVDLSTAGSSLSIDTRGTTIGRTRLEHPTGSAVTVTVHGDLDFRNTLTELVDSATLRVLGDTNELKLGDAVASGSQNLNLLSEGSISVGSIDLNTGSLSIQLDTDNDSISALTATGALDAGSITFTGSALGNDTVWLGGDVTTGSGAIQFVDLSSVQLASNTDLRSATNISMAGEVGVLELVGASGTNILEVRGSNTTLETPSITGTGNVTLELLSDHSILLGNVLLTNGLVEASIGRSTARTDTMFRAGSVQARGLRVTGGDPANDEALFTDQLDLGVDGLLVEDVQSVDLSGDIFSDGDMSLEVGTGGTILLNSDITTNGSDILFLSGRVDVDGTAVRTLTTGGTGVTANTAGQVQWGAGTSIAGVDGAAALEIDTRGVLQGGAVTLGTVVGTGSGVNRLSIQSSGSVSDGTVTIGSVRLIGKSGTPALFQINQSDATATDIIASGVIDLRDGTLGQQAGSIDFGSSRLTPLNSTSVLELRTQHTGLGVVDNGNDGGDIRIGGVANQGSAYFDTLLIDMRGAGTPNESGTLSVTGTGARVLSVDGFNGGSASAVGIEILGTVELAAANPLSLQTNPGGVAGLSSRAIDLRNTSFTGSGSLSLVTGSTVVGNSSNVAGNVFLADVDLSTAGSSLSIDTRGTTIGRTRLEHPTGSAVTVTVHGDLDFRNTLTELVDSATLRVLGDTNELKLGDAVASGSQNLNLLSEGSISVGSIDLNTGSLSIQLDTDNDSISALTATGALDAGSITFTGSALGNDTVWLGGDVTTGSGAIQFVDLSSVQLASNTDLRSATNISMAGEVGVLELVGASGTNILEVRGSNTTLETPSITGTGNVTLELLSDHSILLGNVLLTNGLVEASIGRSTARTDTMFRAGSVQARGLRVTGGDPANDEALFTDQLDLGIDGLLVEDVQSVILQSDIESLGAVEFRDVSGEVQLQNPLTLRGAGVLARTGVGSIRLIGNGAAFQIIATGDANGLELADVDSSDVVSLSLSSEGGMQLGVVTLVPASQLSIQVDSDADSVGASFSSQALQAGTLSLRGSVQRNDDALIAGPLTSLTGAIVAENWRVFEVQGNVSSATQATFSRIFDALRLGATTEVIANTGDLSMQDDVARITLATSLTPVQFVSHGGSVRLASLQSGGLSREVEVIADRDVFLQGTDLAKRLTVRSAQDGLGIGRVESGGTVKATEVRFFAANGIGSATPIQVQTSRIEAKNSHGGVIRLANTASGVALWDVEGQNGTNIHVSQTGGTMSLERFLTGADGTPSVGESNALIQSLNSEVVIGVSGIQVGGLGSLSFLGSGTGDVDFQGDVVVEQGALQVVSGGTIFGAATLQSNSIEFVAQSGVGDGSPIRTKTSVLRAFSQLGDVQVRNESVLPLSVLRLQSSGSGSVSLEQTGGGGLVVFQASTASGTGDITLANPLGSLSIVGNILAGGNGDIELIAGGDIQLLPGSLAQTSSEAGIFKAESGGRFQLQNGAVIQVGASNSQTEALLNRIPTELEITPIANPDGVNVDAIGSASLIVRIGASNPTTVDKNFGIMIDWADGAVDNVPLGARSPLSTYPGVFRFDATGIPFLIQHQYLGNPNVNDPAAPIPIVFTLTTDPFQRIQISDQFGTGNLLTQVVQVDLTVPAAGLFALRIELPQVQFTSRVLVLASEVILQTNSLVAASNTTTDLPSSVSDVVSKSERQYVLRLVTPRNEAGEVTESDNIELSESDISDLPSLFRRLGDNRYRIYAILDGGIELLLRDFYLKKHLPFELDEATADEVPIPGLVQPEGTPGSDMQETPRNESREGERKALDPTSSTRNGGATEEGGSEEFVGNEGLASSILSVLLPQQSFRRAARKLRKQVASRTQQPSNSSGAK
ncbi:hypothetical protein VN12_15210 [Pirellula sp. SH-Sr6A]|uniref:hypothetical protein n=1 Tax=Pirellula sp. SH-Sr6A TaxID=1632865 RepID=UPI00078E2E89|nr:hypothetical protein [Pirellula sp. SH-Sr6A]AMV33474.1 hypothetical protein VN12_15210 [Pirellula sp. SH-Sr6A]